MPDYLKQLQHESRYGDALALAPIAEPLTDAELDLLAARYPAGPAVDYDTETHSRCEAGLDDCSGCIAELRSQDEVLP